MIMDSDEDPQPSAAQQQLDDLAARLHAQAPFAPRAELISLYSQLSARQAVAQMLATEAYLPSMPVDWDNPPAIEWLVEGFIPVDSTIVLVGTSGVGKSFLTVDLLTAGATGGKFIATLDCKPIKALVYLSEGSAGYVDRFRSATEQRGVDLDPIKASVELRTGANMSNDLFQQELIAACARHTPDLVIFDTFSGCSGLMNENDAAMAAAVLSTTKRSIGRASLMILHHPNKSTQKTDKLDARGSGVYRNNVDIMMVMTEDTSFRGTATKYIALTTDPRYGGKVKESEPVTIRGLHLEKVGTSLAMERDLGSQASRADATVKKGLTATPMSARAFAEVMQISEATAYRYLKESVYAEKVARGYVLAEIPEIDEDELFIEQEEGGETA